MSSLLFSSHTIPYPWKELVSGSKVCYNGEVVKLIKRQSEQETWSRNVGNCQVSLIKRSVGSRSFTYKRLSLWVLFWKGGTERENIGTGITVIIINGINVSGGLKFPWEKHIILWFYLQNTEEKCPNFSAMEKVHNAWLKFPAMQTISKWPILMRPPRVIRKLMTSQIISFCQLITLLHIGSACGYCLAGISSSSTSFKSWQVAECLSSSYWK